MREVTLISDDASLRDLADREGEAARSYVVQLAQEDRVLLSEDLGAVVRDEDFETVLRAADVALPAARVDQDSSLSELARALREADASAAIVYDGRQHVLGVVTRRALADALLEWFGARAMSSRRTQATAASGRSRRRSELPRSV